MKLLNVTIVATLSVCSIVCSCGKTSPEVKAGSAERSGIAAEHPAETSFAGRVGLPPDLCVDLETGAISSRQEKPRPLTLHFRLVSSGPAQLNGLQFNVPSDVYVSKYELSQYQMWYICSKLIGGEETFESWTIDRMTKTAPPRVVSESDAARMKRIFLRPDLPAICVSVGEIHKIRFNAKQQLGLNFWIPSVAEWIRMASTGGGMKENLQTIMNARAIKWAGWDRESDQMRYLLPVTSPPPNGIAIGEFIDVFGSAGEVVYVTRQESDELKRIIDIRSEENHRPQSNYKGLRVSENGLLVMGGNFEDWGAMAASDRQAVENFVQVTTSWDFLLGQQLDGTDLRWDYHSKWPTGLRLVLHLEDDVQLDKSGLAHPTGISGK